MAVDIFAPMFQFGAQIIKSYREVAESNDVAKRNAMLIEFQQAVIQFNGMLATVQQQNTSLAADKRELEEKIVCMETWETEKKRYFMATPFQGATVYALKKIMADGQPAHYLCANCYHAGKPSILQIASDKNACTSFLCSICKMAAQTGYRGPATPQYCEDIQSSQ